MRLSRVLGGVGAALGAVAVRDLTQTRHALMRNYPVIGHLRFFFEFIRPEMRQYFIESDNEASPFSRQQRSLVYQRAKGAPDSIRARVRATSKRIRALHLPCASGRSKAAAETAKRLKSSIGR